jgi:hypothetical protein
MDKILTLIDGCWESFLKPALYAFWIFIASLISPIAYIFVALFIAWVFNFYVGMRTDKIVNKVNFSLKKAFDSISQIIFIGLADLIVYTVPYLVGDAYIGIKGITAITYIAAYFYLTNSFKNAKLCYPKSQEIAFIYSILTTEIFSMIKDYFKFRKFNTYDEDKKDKEIKN